MSSIQSRFRFKNRHVKNLLMLTFLCIFSGATWAQKYVFYSHGFIVEGTDPKPEHPRWSVYDFPAVVAALQSDNYELIAEHRPKDTHPMEYAKSLSTKIQTLLDKGTAPEDIAVIGFSRGGRITAYLSHLLNQSDIKVVILAGCWQWVDKEPDITLKGNLLSIIEKTDAGGSCETLAKRSPKAVSEQEITLNTGLEHGAFYRPIDEWIVPVRKFLSAD